MWYANAMKPTTAIGPVHANHAFADRGKTPSAAKPTLKMSMASTVVRGTQLVVQSLCDLGLVGRGPL